LATVLARLETFDAGAPVAAAKSFRVLRQAAPPGGNARRQGATRASSLTASTETGMALCTAWPVMVQ
jgi:hypothetical protein